MSTAEQFYEYKLLDPSADTVISVSAGRVFRICKVLDEIQQTNAKSKQLEQEALNLSKSKKQSETQSPKTKTSS